MTVTNKRQPPTPTDHQYTGYCLDQLISLEKCLQTVKNVIIFFPSVQPSETSCSVPCLLTLTWALVWYLHRWAGGADPVQTAADASDHLIHFLHWAHPEAPWAALIFQHQLQGATHTKGHETNDSNCCWGDKMHPCCHYDLVSMK